MQGGKWPFLDEGKELFCLYYTSNTTPRFFRHGQNCYAMAYGHQSKLDAIEEDLELPTKRRTFKDSRKRILTTAELESEKKRILNTCRSLASRMLHQKDIAERIEHLFDSLIKNEVIDRRLVQIGMQDNDLAPAVAALKELNTVKGRHKDQGGDGDTSPQKVEITYKWKDPLPRRPKPGEATPSATVKVLEKKK